MITLTNSGSTTSQSLVILLGGSATTTYPTVTVASYIIPVDAKQNLSEYKSGNEFTLLTAATETTISATPQQGYTRNIHYISCPNPDTAAMTVTIAIDDNGTNRNQWVGTLPVGYSVYYDGKTGGRGWYVLDSSGAAVVSNSFAVSPVSNSLSGDVAMNNTANYFTGPTVAQGTSGTWLAAGTVTIQDTAGGAIFYAKLWDGTTVIASAATETTAINDFLTISLSGYITSPAGNIRISVRDTTSTSGVIIFNQSGNSKDSTLTAIRII